MSIISEEKHFNDNKNPNPRNKNKQKKNSCVCSSYYQSECVVNVILNQSNYVKTMWKAKMNQKQFEEKRKELIICDFKKMVF